jgi:hypothetical protein
MIRVLPPICSLYYSNQRFQECEIIRNAEDSILEPPDPLQKLKDAVGLRGYQADTVRAQLDRSPYPLIICGDFNDLQTPIPIFIFGEACRMLL